MVVITRKRSSEIQYKRRLVLMEEFFIKNPKPSCSEIVEYLKEKKQAGSKIKVPGERQTSNILKNDFVLVDGRYKRISVIETYYRLVIELLPPFLSGIYVVGNERYSISELIDYENFSKLEIKEKEKRLFQKITNEYKNDPRQGQWYILFAFLSEGNEYVIAKYLYNYLHTSSICIVPGVGGVIIYFEDVNTLSSILPKLTRFFRGWDYKNSNVKDDEEEEE